MKYVLSDVYEEIVCNDCKFSLLEEGDKRVKVICTLSEITNVHYSLSFVDKDSLSNYCQLTCPFYDTGWVEFMFHKIVSESNKFSFVNDGSGVKIQLDIDGQSFSGVYSSGIRAIRKLLYDYMSYKRKDLFEKFTQLR